MLPCGFRTLQLFSEHARHSPPPPNPRQREKLKESQLRTATQLHGDMALMCAEKPLRSCPQSRGTFVRPQEGLGEERVRGPDKEPRRTVTRTVTVGSPRAILTFRPSRSLRSDSCFSSLARTRRTWSLGKHGEKAMVVPWKARSVGKGDVEKGKAERTQHTEQKG